MIETDFQLSDWGLYIHIPFCQARCTYCDFNTVTHMGVDEHQRYMDALALEWERADLPEGRLISLFFGGGTPSLVDPRLIGHFIDRVRSRARDFDSRVEVTLETNPGTVNLDHLKTLREVGVNRLSIGAQAMQDSHLKALNRVHGVEDIKRVVADARSAGFDNVSLDAIYGLPGQCVAEWQETLSELLRLRPDHLSLYRLQVETGTPLADGVRLGTLIIPDDDRIADMADYAEDVLDRSGFEHYEISNWGLKGRLSQHNQLYWTLNSYLGLGAGAHSYHQGQRWWNYRGVRRYIESQHAGDSARDDGEVLSSMEQMREYVWLGLRRRRGVDRERFYAKFKEPLDQVFAPQIRELTAMGLVESENTNLRLTVRGQDLANAVFRKFMAEVVS